MTRAGAGAGAALLCVAWPAAAQAHVKWFTHTNVHDVPCAPSTVLSPIFLTVLAVATLLVFAGFILDAWVARRFPGRIGSGVAFAAVEERLVRAASGGYFICAADLGLVILTPDLPAHATWIAIVQFAIAFFLVWRRTCWIAGFGIMLLYADAIARYGMFHLTDYVFVPGLAIYCTSLSLPWRRLRAIREPLLVGSLAFSLAWTAIEKFLYPQWTDAVVASHPSIGLGVPLGWVVVIAGFVEFTLAFYLVTGRGLLRLGGLGYAMIFLAAMLPFGRLDVFGHLIILAILSVVVLRGATPMQNALHLRGQTMLAESGGVVVLYLLTLASFFAMYYAMQRT